MRLAILTTSFLNSVFLFVPACVLAADEGSQLQSAIKTSQSLKADPMSGSYLLQLVIGLIIVVLCIIALAWLARKVNRFQVVADSALKVLGGLSMGARDRVVLLQVGDEQILLGVSPGKINTLHVLAKPITTQEKPSDGPDSQSFSDKMKMAMVNADILSGKKKDK